MLRVLLYVALLGALFAGAVFSAGNAIGAWEPPTVPLHAPTVSTETGKRQPAKNHAPAKKHKKH